MVTQILIIPGVFHAPRELMLSGTPSDDGRLEIKPLEDQRVQLTLRESEHAAGISITVSREELVEALTHTSPTPPTTPD